MPRNLHPEVRAQRASKGQSLTKGKGIFHATHLYPVHPLPPASSLRPSRRHPHPKPVEGRVAPQDECRDPSRQRISKEQTAKFLTNFQTRPSRNPTTGQPDNSAPDNPTIQQTNSPATHSPPKKPIPQQPDNQHPPKPDHPIKTLTHCWTILQSDDRIVYIILTPRKIGPKSALLSPPAQEALSWSVIQEHLCSSGLIP